MKIYFLPLLALILNIGIAQEIDFCGALPYHQATSQHPDSIYFDRFGNTYDLYPTTQNIINATKIYAGYFEIDYMGPDEFIDVIEYVFDTLSTAIPRKDNYNDCSELIGQELVHLVITTTSGVGYLAAATPMWIPYEFNQCDLPLIVGEVNLIVNSGKGRATYQEDGRIDIRLFDSTSTRQWNSDPIAEPLDSQYDLKTVLMHEALHLYGFSSLMSSDGYGSFSYGGYDLYDNYIYKYDSTVATKVITGNCIHNCWALNELISPNGFDSLVLYNCTANSNSILGIGDPYIAPINGPNGYQSATSYGNYLSHLHPNCNNSDSNYIMQPTIGLKERRTIITDDELDILCKLGYSNARCNGCHIGAFNQFDLEDVDFIDCCSKYYVTCTNQQIEIPFDDLLCNDASGDSQLDSLTDVFYPIGTSTITLIKDDSTRTIKITGTTEGIFFFGYTLTSCDCKQHNAFFRVNIAKCLDCTGIDSCANLFCSNGFEEFNFTGANPLLYSLAGVNWIFEGSDQNTPDICLNNGNKYVQFASNRSTDEGIAIHLSNGIRPGCRLILNFKGAAPNGTDTTKLVLLGSTSAPCDILDSKINFGCTQNNCSFDPICLAEIPITNTFGLIDTMFCPDGFTFQNYQIQYENVTDSVINYILFHIKPGSNNSNYKFWMYLDDIVIKEDCSCAEIAVDTIDCGEYEFTANVCHSGNKYLWNFGDPNSGTNDTSSFNPVTHIFSGDGKYTITLLVTDECGNTKIKTKIIKVSCVPFACECPPGSQQVELENDSITYLIASPSISSFQNKCIKVKGKVMINKNFSFAGSRVLMEPGAEIEVVSGYTFTASYCHFLGCTHMWKSITVKPGAKINLNFDTIQDAEYGVHIYGGSTMKLQYNHFYLNYTGVYAEAGAINQSSPMLGNRFYTNGSFLSSYSGQSNIPGAYGYCGVLAKNSVFGIGVVTSSVPNYFYDLYNGIIAFNSDLSVHKANIKDLITVRSRLSIPRKFTSPDGDGIFTSQSMLTALSNTISGTNGAITDYQGKSLIAYDNVISNSVSGIYCAYPKVECYMDKNQIKNYYLFGIAVASPPSKIDLMITRTDTFRSATSIQGEGSKGIYLENVIGKSLAQVQANVMALDQYAYGGVLKTCQNIGLQENFGTYQGITKRNGIELISSFSNVAYANRVINSQSTVSTMGNAFYFNDARTNKVCCNYSSGTQSGFHFSNTSTMRGLLRTNQINNHRIGLQCDSFTRIDLQANCGNRWTGNYNNYSAAHFGTQFFRSGSRFYVNDCTSPIWPSDPIYPGQSCNVISSLNNDWFQKDGDGTTASCLTDTITCKKPFSSIIRKFRGSGNGGGEGLSDDGSRNATDTLIATHALTAEDTFETRTIWESSYDLLYRLKTNPSICEEDSIMNAFVLFNDTTNLGKFVQADLDLDTLRSLSDSINTILQLRLFIIDSARQEIQIIDSIFLNGSLSEEDSITLDSQRMVWSLIIHNAKLQIDTMLSNYEEERVSALEELEGFLSEITPSNIIESNRKVVLIVYLNSSMLGKDTLTTSQFEDISPIANSCTWSGGRAVILARQLYLLNEYIEFDDDSLCQESEPEPIVVSTEVNMASKEKLTIFPNPNNGNFIVETQNGIFAGNSELHVYDLKGRIVYQIFIEKECKKIEIKKADIGLHGIFICKLTSRDGVWYSPKIIINR